MPDFLELLADYYACDAMAALRPLTSGEIMGCMDTYEMLKTYFAPFDLAPRGTPERIAQMQAAYLAFLDWQEANAGLVSDMRAAAEARVQG
jgi:hypothetical protein